jgi:hypothetical protein
MGKALDVRGAGAKLTGDLSEHPRRIAMRHLLVCLALALSAVPVAACDNFSGLPKEEREFRSQYDKGKDPLAPLTEASPTAWMPFRYQAALGGAAVLAAAATVLVMNNVRRRA